MKLSRIFFLTLALCLSRFALGQAAPALTLTASPTSGTSPVTVILSWASVPAATSCTAPQTLSWSGAKAAAGTQTVDVTLTNRFVLGCTWAAHKVTPVVKVNWTAPTQNVDGTPLTDLQGYIIYADTVNPPKKIAGTTSPGTTNFSIANVPAGQNYFAVSAVGAEGQISSPSASASLNVMGILIPSVTKIAFASVTVTP